MVSSYGIHDNRVANIECVSDNLLFTGVSHLTAPDDFHGVSAIVRWLSYVPSKRYGPLPVHPATDPVDREIAFMPSKAPYDPRFMLAGRVRTEEGVEVWEGGFFDKGSWIETLGAWAQTVVCGRARLGGVPVGVIAVETRTVECHIPADPANLDSESRVVQQAGMVWFPDSAFKTAQAIEDFNREDLPLFIFANWRGFSGGMRDMYEEVLKYGSLIVDALRSYNQPVFIYLPPNGELRGGAWVVVDPTINLTQIEMFADPESRGGVLEPEGIVAIKYKERDVLLTINRLDTVCIDILSQLKATDLSPADRKGLESKLSDRQTLLLPMYHQVAVQFADLHDTAGRMKEKGVITSVVAWRTSREFFYWRLLRRLEQLRLTRDLMKQDNSLQFQQSQAMLRRWYLEQRPSGLGSDREVYEWICGEGSKVIADNMRRVAEASAVRQIAR
eukprot:TRINITY_DN889_c0_g1_i3.p2 TRINITY_DN889_c0_g1~~TRINITY_DN889_c0_g1_i3.p2  ORF type:complete len:445 (-),score=120.80 TRINITY_DN889_c0_g1_i3:60-1394(-)